MNYMHNLDRALSAGEPAHVVLGYNPGLVECAARVAVGLRIPLSTLSMFLDKTITESQLVSEICSNIIAEAEFKKRGVSAKAKGVSFRADEPKPKEVAPKAPSDDDIPSLPEKPDAEKSEWSSDEHIPTKKPISSPSTPKKSSASAIKQHEQEIERLRNSEADNDRLEREQELEREKAAFDPNSGIIPQLHDYCDVIIKHLLSIPRDKRAAKAQETISSLLSAANAILRSPDKHGNYKWKMRPKYYQRSTKGRNPGTGSSGGHGTRQQAEDTATNQAVLEEVIMKVTGDALTSLCLEASISGKYRGDDEYPADTPKGVINAADAIVGTIWHAGISPHGQTTILNNLIKYLLKGIGAKYQHKSEKSRGNLIDKYVQNIVATQGDDPEIGFSVDMRKLKRTQAVPILNSYKAAFAKQGYKTTFALSGPNRDRMEVVAIKTPASRPDTSNTPTEIKPREAEKPGTETQLGIGGEYGGGPLVKDINVGYIAYHTATTIGRLKKKGKKDIEIRVSKDNDDMFANIDGKYKKISAHSINRMVNGAEIYGYKFEPDIAADLGPRTPYDADEHGSGSFPID